MASGIALSSSYFRAPAPGLSCTRYGEEPENGRTLPGYFIRGGPPGEKRPTVLVLGGGDSALEELYGVCSVGAQRRGYNSLHA